MAIHHATVKSAAAKGVILTSTDDTVTAHRPEPNRLVTFDYDEETGATERAKDAWVALDNILDYEAETPSIRIDQEDGDFVAYQMVKGKREELCRDPELEDLFESIREALAGDGIEEEGEDADEERGSVVPAKYKAEYKARGNPNHCGDWLAETLNKFCRVLDDKGKETTDLDRLEAIANANDVSPDRYGRLGIATNGWQGRFRMTVRNMLTPKVAAKGFLFIPEGHGSDSDTEVKAPREWCATHSPKPKSTTEPKASKSAGVQKTPGAGKSKKAKEEAGLAAANAAIKSAKAKAASKK